MLQMILEKLKLTTTRLSHSFSKLTTTKAINSILNQKMRKQRDKTVSTNLKDFDGKTTTNVKKAIDAYFNAVF